MARGSEPFAGLIARVNSSSCRRISSFISGDVLQSRSCPFVLSPQSHMSLLADAASSGDAHHDDASGYGSSIASIGGEGKEASWGLSADCSLVAAPQADSARTLQTRIRALATVTAGSPTLLLSRAGDPSSARGRAGL